LDAGYCRDLRDRRRIEGPRHDTGARRRRYDLDARQHRTLLEAGQNVVPCRVRERKERDQGRGRERDASEREPVAKRPPPEAA
jgi:hypothetical protein